ncbi:unnamed protein product [Ilex paraguariensis]|uniref:F-box protein n=1 Tax=Ilex paraguariensis TaxID=185542 RepID=A0ABC8R049_9AQUA
MAFMGEFSSNWASLPNHLLDSILNNLVPDSDYITFSAVCKPWHCIAIHNRKHRCLSNAILNQIPLLMFPPNIPSDNGRRICGSSYGWFLTVQQNAGLVLVNPFSGGTIQLPPVSELAGPSTTVKVEDSNALLTADPILFPKDYAVVAIYGSYNWKRLAYIKSGDKSCSCVNTPGFDAFNNLVSYRGRIYAVDSWTGMVSFDVRGVSDSNLSSPSSSVKEEVAPNTSYDPVGTYIVVSSAGDNLLLVQRFLIPFTCEDPQFKVFKLQLSPSGKAEIVN